MIRTFTVIAAVAGILFMPVAHPVAEKDPRRVDIVGPEEKLLPLEVNKGRLVRLGAAATSVFIADPDIADVQVKSPTLVYVFGKKAGETTMFAVDSRDRLLANLKVSVRHNLSNLKSAISALLPGSFIEIRSVGDAVMLSGFVNSARKAADASSLAARFVGGAKNVLNRITVRAPNQVNLRVRVAEVNRSVLKRIGIAWESLLTFGQFAIGLATGRDIIANGIISTLVDSQDTVPFSYNSSRASLNGVIDALETEGLISVLAQPNLTALNGETASFLAGGEFPMLVPQGDQVFSVQFKKFGVSLAFTPTILDDGRISMRVMPEVSELSDAGEIRLDNFAVPSLTTRRAETTVELASGQSFAIAGLIQNGTTHSLRKFPGLGDLPVLGALFRSDRFKRDETELVIIVTPYIVRPVSAKNVAMPTDGLVAPSDNSRYLTGEENKPQLREATPGLRPRRNRGLVGGAGFTLE